MWHATRSARQYARWLENELQDAKGDGVDVDDAHSVNLAARSEQVTACARWIIKNKLDTMTPGDLLNALKLIVSSTAERNKAVRALGLHQRADQWQSLDDYLQIEHLAAPGPRTRSADANGDQDADANGDQEATDAEDASEST